MSQLNSDAGEIVIPWLHPVSSRTALLLLLPQLGKANFFNKPSPLVRWWIASLLHPLTFPRTGNSEATDCCLNHCLLPASQRLSPKATKDMNHHLERGWEKQGQQSTSFLIQWALINSSPPQEHVNCFKRAICLVCTRRVETRRKQTQSGLKNWGFWVAPGLGFSSAKKGSAAAEGSDSNDHALVWVPQKETQRWGLVVSCSLNKWGKETQRSEKVRQSKEFVCA